jgi:hypothetical protein
MLEDFPIPMEGAGVPVLSSKTMCADTLAAAQFEKQRASATMPVRVGQ